MILFLTSLQSSERSPHRRGGGGGAEQQRWRGKGLRDGGSGSGELGFGAKAARLGSDAVGAEVGDDRWVHPSATAETASAAGPRWARNWAGLLRGGE
jgi:hypothetical protein